MKFLYFGDFHNRQKAPTSRIDDWETSILNQIVEIKQLALKHNVSAMLQPGDFLDAPRVSDEFIYQIIAQWSNVDANQLVLKLMSGELKAEDLYEEMLKNTPKIGVVGNHELFGHSNKAFKKTSLSLLSQIGFMNLVTKENPIILKAEAGFTVAITGSNYHADIDRDASHKDYIVEKKLGDFHVHIVHGYGTVHDFGTMMPHTKIQELGSTEADLTIMGHDHIGFDPVEINGKWFVNPGSPVLLSNDAKEIARQPKVMLIEFDKNGLKLEMVPLLSAKSGSLVFDVNKVEHKHEQQKKLDEIKETIKNANDGKGKSIVEIVENIANSLNISDEIKTNVRELVSKKAESLLKASASPNRYFIESLELINFQSHTHSLFEFSEGLNVFTGESRSGKTSIIRALGWIYEDYGGASRRFIKTGAKSAEATIKLSNGFIISRMVESKAGGFNGYKVFYPSKNEWETMNTKAVSLIQEILGFSHLQIDKTDSGKIETIPLNFLRQGSPWFFIGDDTTGSQRAKIIGTICGTNIADAAIREVESKNKEFSVLLKNVDKEIVSLDVEIGCMTHVEKLQSDILVIERLLEELGELMQQKALLESSKNALDSIREQAQKLEIVEADLKPLQSARQIVDAMIELSNQRELVEDGQVKSKSYRSGIKNLDEILRVLTPVKEARIKLFELIELAETKRALEILANDIKTVVKTGVLTKRFIEKLPKTEKVSEHILELKMLHEKKATINQYQERLALGSRQQTNLAELVKNLKDVETAKKIIADIASVVEHKKAVEKIKESVAGLDKDIDLEEKRLLSCTQQIKTVKKDYMNVFASVERCPLCLHDITREDAISIAKNRFTKES